MWIINILWGAISSLLDIKGLIHDWQQRSMGKDEQRLADAEETNKRQQAINEAQINAPDTPEKLQDVLKEGKL